MTLYAHGEEAARVAGRIAGEATIIACEPEFGESALADAVSLRRAGTHYVLSVHFEDVRARLVREQSVELCAQYATWDEVRLRFDQLAAAIIATPTELPKAARGALFEALRLADSVILRSWAEFVRLSGAVYSVRRDIDIVVIEDPDVPESVSGAATDAVVYAPSRRADELANFVAALGDLEVPVTIIARDQPTIPTRVRFVPPSETAAALGRARVIVDASGNDPGTALALAKLGRPLVVSSVGGAAEIVRNARSYDLWNRRSILTAVVNGFTADLPILRKGHYEDRPTPRTRPVFDASGPLVSVVVPTFNRPELLGLTLESIERQTYPVLEVIVVNDAGRDIADVVARFPRARLVNQPENRGPSPARNRGLAEARGEFVIFFDDDDEMFPDHIAAMVSVLQRSGLDVAYGQMINCFAKSAGPGRYVVDRLEGHVALMDHADIQWAGSLATTALMFRRSLVDVLGPIDESLPSAEDYEFWLRLATGREWARVPDVTSMYFIRNDGSNRSAGGARKYFLAHQAIYAKHPSERPLVRAGRFAMLELFSQTAAPSG
jgi:GT2 family glycosyltransferase